MPPGPPRFSVIVASWERPSWLRRCLRGLAALDYPAFEVVVVADAASLGTIDATHPKCVEAAAANISAARNAGIAASSGEICAFIDDDAVPEPLWLARLGEAFRQTGADAVAGFVRGRNGISFQSRVASVDAEAETHAEPCPGEAPFVPVLAPGRALKLVGTNMGVRRAALQAVGGFDTAFRFFLDDSDLSLRLAGSGHRLAAAPLAEVHHAFASSARRSAGRAPLDLFDIGRSTAVFARRHLGRAEPEILDRATRRERARLIRHMVAGGCEPGDVPRRLAGLAAGWREGSEAALEVPRLAAAPAPAFRPMPRAVAGHEVVASRLAIRRRAALRRAEALADSGRRVTIFSFSLTPVRHHLRYTASGVWFQTGGLFGRSDRNCPIFRWCSFAYRLNVEIRRVAKARGIGDGRTVRRWD